MKKKTIVSLLGILCIATLLLSACNFPLTKSTATVTATNTQSATASSSEGIKLAAADVYDAGFAPFQEQSVNIPAKFTNDYTLPLDLTQVGNLGDFSLSAGQQDALKTSGFVVTPPSTDSNKIYTEFYQAYESIRYEQTPVFVTTDSIYHVYHLVFDKMLRDLERDSFIPTLKELTSTMVAATTAQYQSLKGTTLENASLRNVAYFSIAASLLKTGDAVLPEAKAYVDAELSLINAHAGTAISPLWRDNSQALEFQ